MSAYKAIRIHGVSCKERWYIISISFTRSSSFRAEIKLLKKVRLSLAQNHELSYQSSVIRGKIQTPNKREDHILV